MAGTIKHSWNGTVLTITSDSGTSSADLRGEKGDTGIRGAQGAPGIVSDINLAGYATEQYVNEAIANVEPDLTGYATEEYVNNAITENVRKYPDWSHLKWYVMGDSLTDRRNNHAVKRYYDWVQEKTGIQIILDGIGGTGYGAGISTHTNFVERVKNIPQDVDVVTIFGSVNDVRYAGDIYNLEIYNALSWLALNRVGMRVIVVPPALCLTNSEYDLSKRGTLWKNYCDRLQVCALACDFRYVSDMYDCPPFNPNFAGHLEKFFKNDPEGIHPDDDGHKALAPYFFNALQQELALKV